MTKTALISVTISRGCHLTVPHPSGIAELRKTLNGGDTLQVAPDTAAELYAARLVNHPQTGAPPPPPPAVKAPYVQRGPTISINGGPFQDMSGLVAYPGWESTAEQPVSRNRVPEPPPHDVRGPTVEQLRQTEGY